MLSNRIAVEVKLVAHPVGIAVRCPIPGHRVRETIIVPQAGLHEAEADTFADWYAHEDSWLDWALQQLGYASFDTLVQE
jgi:hypothetical protein